MNRRQFLKSLAAIGAAISFPIDLASASTKEVNDAWKVANLTPIVFTVAQHGTISIGDYVEPGSRSEMYGIEANWSNRQELIEVIQSNWQLDDIAQSTMDEVLADSNSWAEPEDVISFDSWENWVAAASDDELTLLERNIRDWLETQPDVSAEYEWLPPMNHVTPESSAYSFFKSQPDELLDALGIVFVEGDTPGSTYFGAELHYDIALVNETAESKNIPIRFISEDDCVTIKGAHHG